MLTNYYTLKGLVSELENKIENAEIIEVFSQNKNELVITFLLDGVYNSLVLSIDPSNSYLFFRTRLNKSKHNSVNLFSSVYGEIVSKISIHPTDRIIEIVLSDEKKLVVMFFRGESNICLVQDGKIIAAFKREKKILNNDFIVDKRDFEINKYLRSSDELITALRTVKEKNIQRVFNKVLPVLSSIIVKEILFRARLDYSRSVNDYTNVELEFTWNSFKEVFNELNNPLPRVYYDNNKPAEFSIIELKHISKLDSKTFNSINEAVIAFLFHKKGEREKEKFKEEFLRKIDNELLFYNSSIDKLKEALSIDRSDEYRKYADFIMSNLTSIQENQKEILMTDGEKSITIPLDTKLSPIQNANVYYEKSKKAKELFSINKNRLDNVISKNKLLKKIYEEMKNTETAEEFKKVYSKYKTDLENLGITESEEKKKELTLFRRFIVDGNFEVLCGKNSENNDLLTMKYAKPEDLWFHARGAGGSHVILRVKSGKGEPSKRAIEEAAAIAAFYSQAKNSKTVPVVMTKKKYVRKPKGASPGTVTLQQEKVIFVSPGLPKTQ